MNVYTDGACSRNGFPDAKAGYGVYFEGKQWDISRPLKGKQTNNRAEMYAVYAALKRLYWKDYRKNVTIYSDSKIVCDGFARRKSHATANFDLWLKLYHVFDLLECTVSVEWCKGHNGNPGNEWADKLAVNGKNKHK